jgi:hypothetical protein
MRLGFMEGVTDWLAFLCHISLRLHAYLIKIEADWEYKAD